MTEPRTSFTRVDYTLSGLLEYIDLGDIGLPDIQRPFVWTAAKVRDLLDSMYRGFPVGYLLFWKNANVDGVRQIGLSDKGHKVPALLIVDGQQRLTSLYAVFRGKTVVDDDYREVRIEIAFRPRDGRFEVIDAAIRKNPEFIPDISVIWTSGKPSGRLQNDFVHHLENHRGVLSENERDAIGHNLDRLFDLKSYPFTALEILPSVDEEEVADIFVRINSQGVKLNQADFILTLLSVFWDEGRKELENFCRHSHHPAKPGQGPSPFNHFIQPSPDQLLRVAVALGFSRARLRSAYQVLRGKDVETDSYISEKREVQFAMLKAAQSDVVDLTNWHQFLSCLTGAGFRGRQMISSQIALLYAYVFYLVGRTKYRVPDHIIRKLIGRWFFFSQLAGRYTGSPETAMDADLSRLKGAADATAFVAALERIAADTFTEDYWAITLPNGLATSAARSPALFAYFAALSVLNAPVLFSHKRVQDLFDPTIQSKKKATERHHLFPRAWLEKNDISDLRIINQIANFAPIEWPDNIDISATPPSKYVPEIRKRFTETDFAEMQAAHGLPEGWENMPYEKFLNERRRCLAGVIRRAYEKLR